MYIITKLLPLTMHMVSSTLNISFTTPMSVHKRETSHDIIQYFQWGWCHEMQYTDIQVTIGELDYDII